MFIAHLPAGYLLARRMAPGRRALIVTAMVASVVPDLDLLWFYFVNGRQDVHHAFAFHWPLFWVAVAGIGWALGAGRYAGVALAALMLHMVLDSLVGGISWFAPFSDRSFHLIDVPAIHDWWVWNFVLHWTFALEIAILLWAGVVAVRR